MKGIPNPDPTPAIPGVPPSPEHRPVTLYLIIGLKLIKGITLLLIALGLYQFNGKNLGVAYDSLIRLIQMDSEAGFWGTMGNWFDGISLPLNVWIVPCILAYGLFSFVEAVGLWLRSSWGGWLAIAESTFFIPIELYKLRLGFTWGIFSILILNVVIVVYLFLNRHRLFSQK